MFVDKKISVIFSVVVKRQNIIMVMCSCCSEEQVDWESVDGCFLVCPGCGYVDSANGLVFQTEWDQTACSGTTHYSKQKRSVSSSTLPKRCYQVMDALGIPPKSSFRAQVEQLASSILQEDLFRSKFRLRQMYLYACIYSVACSNSKVICIKEIAKMVPCDPYHLARVYGVLKKHFNWKDSPCLDPELFLDRLVHTRNLLTPPLDPAHVKRRALFILKICRDYWISDGRSPFLIAASAVLLAIDSLSPPPPANRSKRVKLEKRVDRKVLEILAAACQMRSTTKLVAHRKEMIQALVAFAKKAPWLTFQVTEKNIILYMDELESDLNFIQILSSASAHCKHDMQVILPPCSVKSQLKYQDLSLLIRKTLAGKKSNDPSVTAAASATEREDWIVKMTQSGYSEQEIIEKWNIFPSLSNDCDADELLNENELETYFRSRPEIKTLLTKRY